MRLLRRVVFHFTKLFHRCGKTYQADRRLHIMLRVLLVISAVVAILDLKVLED